MDFSISLPLLNQGSPPNTLGLYVTNITLANSEQLALWVEWIESGLLLP